MLPLFPLHGLYVAAMVRYPGYIAIGLILLMPAAGLYGMSELLHGVSAEFLSGVRILALFGVLYASLKALAQPRVTPLLAYAGVAFYSILWWHAADLGTLSTQALTYAASVVLITTGLLLITSRLRARYGEEALDRIGGLARPMPRFAILMTLLTMAAVGLPPFGFFSAYVAILLRHPVHSWELIIVVFAQFAACFYLFRFMQRILFGPHPTEVSFEDLNRGESGVLLIVLLILLVVGLVPYGFFDFDPLASGYPTPREMTASWIQ
jgi:NADH-quinone oxidoreductase subunit M